MSRSFPKHPLRWLVVALTTVLAACGDPTTASTADLPEASFARAASRTTSLTVSVSGLPSGVAAAITVNGSKGFVRTVTGTTTLSGIASGTYTVNAQRVTANGSAYAPQPITQSVNLKNGSARTLLVSYAVVPTTGTLNVAVTMPDATPAQVTVTGPNGFARTLTATTSLASLAPGSYTVSAAGVTSATGITYAASPATQTASITAGVTSSASVAYTASGVLPSPDFNVQIIAATLTQAVQSLANGVTLIAGRDAMLRVFPVATITNAVKPAVRVRVYQNGALQATLTATTTGTAVPTAINQGSLASSWNVLVPGALVQPGLAIQAEVDPDNLITETSDNDNLFPASGSPLAFTVRAVPAFNITLVPVTLTSSGLTGNVTAGNAAAFMQETRDMLPMGQVNTIVRAAYTSSQTLASNGDGWSPLLSEINALRSTDRSANHYYGVVKVGYGSGVAGMGYIGAPASIGWDYLPSGSGVLAHELGHNFGRWHAPCGGPSGTDASYPYAGGTIGVFGFNVRTNTIQADSRPDLMTYCGPEWISDYNFTAMMNYRGFATSAFMTGTASTIEQPSLLVWGRIARDGSLVLEPAMRLTARPVLPTAGGEYEVSAYDANGGELFSYPFTAIATADGEEGGAHFAFVIPMNDVSYDQLTRLELSGRGRTASRSSRQTPAAAQAAARGLDIAAVATARAQLRWNANAFPMVMVRDAVTGDVLSFARGGDMRIDTGNRDVDVIVSDGVKSASARVGVRGR